MAIGPKMVVVSYVGIFWIRVKRLSITSQFRQQRLRKQAAYKSIALLSPRLYLVSF